MREFSVGFFVFFAFWFTVSFIAGMAWLFWPRWKRSISAMAAVPFAWFFFRWLGAVTLVLIHSGCKSDPPVVLPSPTPKPSASQTAQPTPVPSGSQSVTALATQEKPMPGKTPARVSALSISLSRNEVTGWIVYSTKSQAIAPKLPAGVTLKLYSMPLVKTKIATTKESPVGEYYDPLVPETGMGIGYNWVDFSVSGTVQPGDVQFLLGDLPVSLHVGSRVLPAKPTMPLYIGVEPNGLLQGHRLPGESPLSVQQPLVQAYVDLLRAHRIEPYGAWIVDPAVSATGSLDTQTAGFSTITLGGLASPDLVNHGKFSAAYLKAAAKIPGAWGYMWDEPSPSDFPAMIAYLKLAKAAGLPTMVTTAPTAALRPLVDHFTIAFEDFSAKNTAPGYWIYGACASHGCGSGELDGTPDLMLDQPSVNARAYVWAGYAMGGKAMLYYDSVYAYYDGPKDPWTNQYFFSGNGDGTLIYPGRKGERGFTSEQPVASIRLKMLRQGLFDVEYLQGKTQTVVKDAYHWSKNHADYEAVRK